MLQTYSSYGQEEGTFVEDFNQDGIADKQINLKSDMMEGVDLEATMAK